MEGLRPSIDPLVMDENLPVGTTIAQLLLDDLTGNEEIIYELEVVDLSGLPGVTAWFDASDHSRIVLDNDRESVLSWQNGIDPDVYMTSNLLKPESGHQINGKNAILFGPNEFMITQREGQDWNPFSGDGQIGGYMTSGSWYVVVKMFENKRTQFLNFGVGWSVISLLVKWIYNLGYLAGW